MRIGIRHYKSGLGDGLWGEGWCAMDRNVNMCCSVSFRTEPLLSLQDNGMGNANGGRQG